MNDAAGIPLAVLIVDDEALARSRLADVLGDLAGRQPVRIVGQAANGQEALRMLETSPVDVVFADIRMPGMNGVELARHLRHLPQPPAVIFTTAYDQYAVQAFETAAVDYLLKPVRADRLAQALERARLQCRPPDAVLAQVAPGARTHFSVNERGRILLVAVDTVVYLKAEHKYVTARTPERKYLLDESLLQLEQEFAHRFLRIHRSCLVARAAVCGFEKGAQEGVDGNSDVHWEVLLSGVSERLPVSRRQWPAVRQLLGL